MWRIQIVINLTDDEYTEEEKGIQVRIEESLPEGFKDLDNWETDVRRIGFQAMREMFRCGIELFEKKLLSEYVHKDEGCHTVRRGKLDFTLASAVGKVTFPRQRLRCDTCGKWVTPLNEALGLHEGEKERTTLALQQLSSLCAVNQTYPRVRGDLAEKMVKEITQDSSAISHQQIKLTVDTEGNRLRQYEEQERKCVSLDVIREIVDRQPRSPTLSGQFYICLDGIYVKKQGMHWDHNGADNLCALRTLWLNEDWDSYWQQRRKETA